MRRRAATYRWKRLDKFLKKCYGATDVGTEEAAGISRKVMVDLAVFGEDEKVRLLAAQALKGSGGGRIMEETGILDEIRQDMARGKKKGAD